MDAEPGSAALGIFVAPGALGITLGTLAARLDSVMVLPLTLFLILLACVVYKRRGSRRSVRRKLIVPSL